MKTALGLRMLLAGIIMLGGTGFAAKGFAQELNLGAGDDAQPLSIDASGGIEWNQPKRMFTAEGPATATRGDMVLHADEFRAYYRVADTGANEVFRLDAVGHVRIITPGRVATGGFAVYDVDKSVIVLKDGNPVTLTSGANVVTAKGQMEFWDKRNIAVARGGATAIQADKRLRADVMTVNFEIDKDGNKQVGRIEAFDNVSVKTSSEEVFSERAAYNVPTGLARLTGSVKIIRGGSQINGCSADIDMNTGVSRLNSCAKSETQAEPDKSGRVHGVLIPTNKK